MHDKVSFNNGNGFTLGNEQELSCSRVKTMSLSEMEQLCCEIRQKIIATVRLNGGHLASNLGIVEATVALCFVFDFPTDKIVFDVGHQCYPYKILTDRADSFDTLRLRGGISGFPKRNESEYDSYDSGHAGTAISVAQGLAKARDLQKQTHSVIALVGDGSFNNGVVYEAFNSVSLLNSNFLTLLNDNGMSISPTVGGTHDQLNELKTKQGEAYYFKRYGMEYIGVVDGNDLQAMILALQRAKELLKNSSVVLHFTTQKGKGYRFAEESPEYFHGISPATGAKPVEYSQILGDKLCDLAKNDASVVAVTAAMTNNLGLGRFFREYPDRSFDVGICEEHSATLCAGLALGGLKPFMAVYSTFLQRMYDELLHDVAAQKLPVVFCVDRGGLSGADGETHQGVFDLSFLRSIPNLTVASPKDKNELCRLIDYCYQNSLPAVIRYPRFAVRTYGRDEAILKTDWEVLQSGERVTVLAVGERMITLAYSIKNRTNLPFTIVSARFVKPLDTDFLDGLQSDTVVTLEDNVLSGGFGNAVLAYLAERRITVKSFGYADTFIPHGEVESLMADYGINEDGISDYIRSAFVGSGVV